MNFPLQRGRSSTRRYRPEFDVLETRQVLNVTFAFDPVSGKLDVKGDQGGTVNDSLTITGFGEGSVVFFGTGLANQTLHDVKSITAKMGKGNDDITVTLARDPQNRMVVADLTNS